jgi:serine/threonine-protein kinase
MQRMSLTPGTRVGPYEVIAEIGAGGMGEVYRAHDTKLGRDVALKILPASLAGDADRLARFRREAQVLAALNHPNIAHIHGFEDSGNIHALVMELVEGPTLADLMREKFELRSSNFDVLEWAVPIARQIAEAMEYAHESGIIHRDLKPANIKVRDDGAVKVLDFGLAKALATESTESSGAHGGIAANSPTLTNRATQLGVILGTAAYMSPEQAKGRPVDRRTDIWAFGVIAFEMLSGRRGYDAEDVSETLAAVLTREVDWTQLPKSTPARLQALLRDCLARDPKHRLRDIGEARRVLDQLAGASGSGPALQAPAATRGGSNRVPWIVAAAALVLAAIAGAFALRPAVVPPVSVVRSVTVLRDLSAFVAVSPDATKVVYATATGGNNSTTLTLRYLDQFEGKPIPGTDGAAWPVFSPDGQWIAFSEVSGPAIRKIPVTGGTATKIGEGSFGDGVTWGPDDSIVYPGPKGLMKISAAGGAETTLTTIDAAKNETAHRRPQFLPGGKHLLFTIDSKGAERPPQFAILDLAAGTHRTVAPGGFSGRYVSTGHLMFMRAATLFAVPFDLAAQAVTGPEVPVVEAVSQLGPPGTGDYAVAENGTLVYFSASIGEQGTTLAWADRAGKTSLLPGQPTRRWGTGRLSLDGRMLANAIEDTKSMRDIWILDVERGTTTRVTFGGGNSDTPVWTRNSRQIYFGSEGNGKPGIYRAPADASGKPVLVLQTPTIPSLSSVSPDGRYVLFSQDNKGTDRIMVVALDDKGAAGEAKPLHDTSAAEFSAEISPDGKWVAYTSTESGVAEVYVHAFPTPGARVSISTDGGLWPRWSRDGRELLYWEGIPAGRLKSVTIPADGSMRLPAPKLIFQLVAGTTWDTTSNKDRFLVELTGRQQGTQLAIVTNWFEELKNKAKPK